MGSLWFGSPRLGMSLFEPFSATEEIGEIGSGDKEGGFPRGLTGQGHGTLLGCSSCNRGKATAPGNAFSGGLTSCFPRLGFLVGRGPFCPLVRLGDN